MDAPEVSEYHTKTTTIPYQSSTSGSSSLIFFSKTLHNPNLIFKQGPHFGRPGQLHYTEAIAWLKENIQGRRIKCELLKRDQYERVVALPLLPCTFWPWRHYLRWWMPQGGTTTATTRNLPLEMIRAGWGVVYTQKGAVYGSDWEKETYLAAEAEARSVPFPFPFPSPFSPFIIISSSFPNLVFEFIIIIFALLTRCLGVGRSLVRAAQRGMWQYGTDIELPTDYKKRYRVTGVEAKAEEEGQGESAEDVERDERVSFWGRIFGRRKRAGDSPS